MFRLATVTVVTVAALFLPTLVTAAGQVKVTPDQRLPGQSVTMTGTGWAPNDQILVSFTAPSGNVVPLGVVPADANGNFQQVVPVPAFVPPGSYIIDGNGVGGSVAVRI